jgi:hypothetical protein
VPLLRRMLKGNALHLGWAMPLEVEGFLVDEGFAHISIFFFPPHPQQVAPLRSDTTFQWKLESSLASLHRPTVGLQG